MTFCYKRNYKIAGIMNCETMNCKDPLFCIQEKVRKSWQEGVQYRVLRKKDIYACRYVLCIDIGTRLQTQNNKFSVIMHPANNFASCTKNKIHKWGQNYYQFSEKGLFSGSFQHYYRVIITSGSNQEESISTSLHHKNFEFGKY